MKLLFDLFPIILFFAAFKLFGIFAATATAIAATVLQIVWSKYRHGKVDTMLWVSFAIIAVFGGATLLLHDENFIKWKPTILYWVFSTTLLFSNLLFGKNLMRSLLHEKLALPAKVWDHVNLAWSLFFGRARACSTCMSRSITPPILGQLQAVRHHRHHAAVRAAAEPWRCR